MNTVWVRPNLHHAASQTLGQAGKGSNKPRVLQKKCAPLLTAACRNGNHSACYSLNCICGCGHGGRR